jgi:hypothetical protein
MYAGSLVLALGFPAGFLAATAADAFGLNDAGFLLGPGPAAVALGCTLAENNKHVCDMVSAGRDHTVSYMQSSEQLK